MYFTLMHILHFARVYEFIILAEKSHKICLQNHILCIKKITVLKSKAIQNIEVSWMF